mmetsp:Transcript_52253/g.126280  ORF Transcript_52253/g.126280 Transcript_52253/m.126280 type:complete len:85 (-) Transcript_52253:210-464(-)
MTNGSVAESSRKFLLESMAFGSILLSSFSSPSSLFVDMNDVDDDEAILFSGDTFIPFLCIVAVTRMGHASTTKSMALEDVVEDR